MYLNRKQTLTQYWYTNNATASFSIYASFKAWWYERSALSVNKTQPESTDVIFVSGRSWRFANTAIADAIGTSLPLLTEFLCFLPGSVDVKRIESRCGQKFRNTTINRELIEFTLHKINSLCFSTRKLYISLIRSSDVKCVNKIGAVGIMLDRKM